MATMGPHARLLDSARRRLLVAALSTPLAGCTRRSPQAGARTLLVFKHAKLFGDPGPLRALLDAFERQHPGIEVRDETLPSSSDEQHQFYAINLQAGSPAFDVFAVDVIWVAGFGRAGWLRDLSAVLQPAARSAFFDGPVRSVTIGERAFAVPWFMDAGLLYYRTDLLSRLGLEAPQTWDALVRIAQAAMAQQPGVDGYVWQGKQYEGLVCNVLEFLWSNGGAAIDEGAVVLDSERNRTALAYMADLVHRYRVTPASVTTATEEPCRHTFGQGRAVFMRNWPYAWRLFQAPDSRVRGRVGMAPLPHFPGSPPAAALGGWQLAVNANSRHPEVAEALVAHLTSTDAQRALAIAYGFQPTRVALYRDAELSSHQPQLPVLAAVFAAARPRPVTPRYVRLSQVLQSEFSAAISGVKSAADALASAQRKAERVLDDATTARA
jgi:multiple sugar transport system substrate-binding protein